MKILPKSINKERQNEKIIPISFFYDAIYFIIG